MVSFDILIVERGIVPVDVNVNVVLGEGLRDDSLKVEGEVGTLGEWIWRVGGGALVEGECINVVRALSPGDCTCTTGRLLLISD